MPPRTLIAPAVAALALAVGAGWKFHPPALRGAASNKPSAPSASAREQMPTQVTYACPMHPDVTSDRPGRCPICGMDLVRISAHHDHTQAAEPALQVTPEMQRRIGVLTAPVTHTRWAPRSPVPAQVIADERRAVNLSPKVEGWIRRLGVSVVGQPVRKGQVLFEIYSPDLQQRQRDYLDLLARRDALVERAGGMGASGGAGADLMLASVARERFRARERLVAADVPESVLVDVERSRKVRDVIPVLAEHDGVVTAIGAREGAYVMPSQTVLAYADLHVAWIELSLTPEALGRMHAGQTAELAVPGGEGAVVTVALDPSRAIVDATSRQARLRVPLPPGARGFLPGTVVRADLMGDPRDVLVVPRDAVTTTSSGSRVVLAGEANHFRLVPVELGEVDDEGAEIRHGLASGDQVVVNGQFLLGAEAALTASRHRMEARRRDEASTPLTSSSPTRHAP